MELYMHDQMGICILSIYIVNDIFLWYITRIHSAVTIHTYPGSGKLRQSRHLWVSLPNIFFFVK